MALARTLFPVAALVAALAGCAEGGGSDFPGDERPGQGTATYAIDGTFTRTATQAEMEELLHKAHDLGGDMVSRESFPVQFSAYGLSASACDSFRTYAESRPYVDDVGSCSQRS